MTNVSMQPRPRLTTGALVHDGPVLVATKPFNGLEEPLALAQWLAAREECALRIVSVLEPTEGVVASGVPPFSSQYFELERTALAAQIRRELVADDAGSDSVRVDVLEGPSAQTVVDAARGCGARVIVVGTGRHDPVGRHLYGERALQIVSRSDRPVLIVPRGAVAAPLSVAVVAVDFSPASVRAAHAVLPLLAPGGRLIAVHVKTGVTLKEETAGWWNDAYERRCADLFAQFLRQLPRPRGVTFDSKFLRGDIVPRVVDYAAQQGAGLIACGRLGHTMFERVFVGSVSSSLIRHASCPILVAPELSTDAAWH